MCGSPPSLASIWSALPGHYWRIFARRRGSATADYRSAKCREWPLASLRGNAAISRFWGHIGRGAMARKQLARKLLFPSKLKSGCQRPRSVLLSQHNGDHTLGDRFISRIWRMTGEGFVVIVDLEKDRVAIGFERAKIMLLVR